MTTSPICPRRQLQLSPLSRPLLPRPPPPLPCTTHRLQTEPCPRPTWARSPHHRHQLSPCRLHLRVHLRVERLLRHALHHAPIMRTTDDDDDDNDEEPKRWRGGFKLRMETWKDLLTVPLFNYRVRMWLYNAIQHLHSKNFGHLRLFSSTSGSCMMCHELSFLVFFLSLEDAI